MVVLAGDLVLELNADHEFELTIDGPTGFGAFAVREDGRVALGIGPIVEPRAGGAVSRIELMSPAPGSPWLRPKQLWRSCQRTLDVLESRPEAWSVETADFMAGAYLESCQWSKAPTKEQVRLLAASPG